MPLQKAPIRSTAPQTEQHSQSHSQCRPFMFGEILFRYIVPQEAPWDDIPPQSLLQFKFLNGIVKLISWIPLQYRSQCLFNAITNMKNCKLYTEMINDEEFVLFYLLKDRTFSRKNKVHLKMFTKSTETKIANLIWRRNSLARGFNFLPLTRQWKYTKRSQHINCLLTFAKTEYADAFCSIQSLISNL